MIQVNISLMNWLNFELRRTRHAQCADPEIFVRVEGGVQFRRPENSIDNVFISFQLISMLFKGFRDGPTFPGVGGVHTLISIDSRMLF